MRLQIGAAEYRVKRVAEVEADDKLGMTRFRRSLIHISKKQSPSSERDTLLHEVLHAVCYESGLSLVLGIGDEDEERIIRILAPWLLTVIRDNPHLIEQLTA
jgi:hypothetical protein